MMNFDIVVDILASIISFGAGIYAAYKNSLLWFCIMTIIAVVILVNIKGERAEAKDVDNIDWDSLMNKNIIVNGDINTRDTNKEDTQDRKTNIY